jgi:DNA modification methylase
MSAPPVDFAVKPADRTPAPYFATDLGGMQLGDAQDGLRRLVAASVDLVIASPPFNEVEAGESERASSQRYLHWFQPLAAEMHRALKPSGSLVIELGGVWLPRHATRSLYQFELLILLCRELGFHLAQEFYAVSPGKAAQPQWMADSGLRVRDAVNCLWWLSKTPRPKARGRRVADSAIATDADSIIDGVAAEPVNVLTLPRFKDSAYLRYCRQQGLEPQPNRFPPALPEFLIRLLTDPGDLVVDPFAGSCVTGAVAEQLGRRWLCIELSEEYLRGAVGRFDGQAVARRTAAAR